MKITNKGYSLMEMLMALIIIGGLCLLAIPAAIKKVPNNNVTKYEKALRELQSNLDVIINDPTLYGISGAYNIDAEQDFMISPLTHALAEGNSNQVLCSNLSQKLNILEEEGVCVGDIPSFTTVNGTTYSFAVLNNHKFDVTIDVDPDNSQTRVVTAESNCSNKIDGKIDKFLIQITTQGKIIQPCETISKENRE